MYLWKALLIVLNICCQIQLQMGFGFPSLFPACSDNVPVFLQGHLPLLWPLVCFLFIHPYRSPAAFA